MGVPELGLFYQVAPAGLKVQQGAYLEFHKDVTPGLLVALWALWATGHWEEQARQWTFMHNVELTPQAAQAGLESKEPQCLSDIRKAIPLAKD